ncbi:MAG: hypothetical protein ACJAX1_000951 [Neolewinella sp.]|jgi:hypothetical protein
MVPDPVPQFSRHPGDKISSAKSLTPFKAVFSSTFPKKSMSGQLTKEIPVRLIPTVTEVKAGEIMPQGKTGGSKL